MRHFLRILIYGTLSSFLNISAEANRPHGVGPDFAKYYKSETEFTCIFNPSITLKRSQVNDDYCDCPDGSDEPGTAACTSISALSPSQPLNDGPHNSSLAIPGYYCKNKNHIPAYLSHTYVNDGVCDYELCCDGSDEWAGVGGVKCVDKCMEIGQEWKRQDTIKKNIHHQALIMRAELVTEARLLIFSLETTQKDLESEIIEKEQSAAELKLAYETIERRERSRIISSGGKASKLSIFSTIAKKRIDAYRHALSEAVSRNEALEKKVKSLETILSTFKDEYNPNFNDEGVKRAVRAWVDYAAIELMTKPSDTSESQDYDVDELLEPDSEEHGINWSQWQMEEESDGTLFSKVKNFLPEPARNWFLSKLIDLRIFLMDKGILAQVNTEALESKAVTEAREAFQAVANEVDVKKKSLIQNKNDLSKDYGPDKIFLALKGRCIEKDSGEYTYELCWLEDTKQKSKKSGTQTNMGSFTKFDKVMVDEEVSPSGKGLGSGERLALKYENGQSCWNGPNRETTVVVACANQDEIWKVSELEKCIYRMEVGSPAACEANQSKKL